MIDIEIQIDIAKEDFRKQLQCLFLARSKPIKKDIKYELRLKRLLEKLKNKRFERIEKE